ncbi:MAG: VanZ family protein [Mycoplasmatales bacterium]
MEKIYNIFVYIIIGLFACVCTFISQLLLSFFLGDFVFNNIFIYALFIVEFLVLSLLFRYIKKIYKYKDFTLTSQHLKEIKIIYILFLIIFLFFRNPETTKFFAYNLMPLYLDQSFSFSIADPIWMFNLLVFIPYPFLYKIKIIYTVMLFIIIELLQPLLKVGSFDINDFIFYIFGFSIGFVVLKIIENKKDDTM